MIGPAYGRYAFVHGRLGAMKAELLTARQWDRLLGGRTYEEQHQALRATSYAPWLAATAEATLTTVRNALHRAARKIQRSVPARAAGFVRAWGRRDLLRNVKTILQGKALRRPEEQIQADLLRLEPPEEVPAGALLRCASLDDALDLLESTPLRGWIRAARRLHQRDPNLFGLDVALDRLYYPELFGPLGRLDRSDRAAVTQLVALEIDQVNLLWLLRYRLNYRLSPAETYYLLVPVTGTIGAEQLKDMVRQNSLEAIVARVPAGPMHGLLASCGSVWQVEVALWRHRARQARLALKKAAFTLGECLALLMLKEIEIRDLVAVLEGVRLGAARADVLEQLAGAASD